MAHRNTRPVGAGASSGHRRFTPAIRNENTEANIEGRQRLVLMGLPGEVRRRIWISVLGGRCIHLRYWHELSTLEGDTADTANTLQRAVEVVCPGCMHPKDLKRAFEDMPPTPVFTDDLSDMDRLLGNHHDIIYCTFCSAAFGREPLSGLQFRKTAMSLLLANKAVNLEATEVLYGTNRFSVMTSAWTFYDNPSLCLFLRDRTRNQKAYIKSISIVVPYVYMGPSQIRCTDAADEDLLHGSLKHLTSLRDVLVHLTRMEEDHQSQSVRADRSPPLLEDYLKVFRAFRLDSFTVVMSSLTSGRRAAADFQQADKVAFARELERMVLERRGR